MNGRDGACGNAASRHVADGMRRMPAPAVVVATWCRDVRRVRRLAVGLSVAATLALSMALSACADCRGGPEGDGIVGIDGAGTPVLDLDAGRAGRGSGSVDGGALTDAATSNPDGGPVTPDGVGDVADGAAGEWSTTETDAGVDPGTDAEPGIECPNGPAPDDTSCDGIDSDCDGATDEDCNWNLIHLGLTRGAKFSSSDEWQLEHRVGLPSIMGTATGTDWTLRSSLHPLEAPP